MKNNQKKIQFCNLKRTQTPATFLFLLAILAFAPSVNAKDVKMKKIVDASGKEVTIPVNPKRIAIASDREFTEPFIAAGIIPIAVASQHEFAPYLKKEVAKIKGLVDLGHHKEIDLEALAAAKPDLIIVRNIHTWGSPELVKEAKKIAPTVQINAMSGLRNLINEIGNIMGKNISVKLNKRVDAAVAKMRNAVKYPSKVSVSHVEATQTGFWLYRENSNIATQLMKEAGYSRPKSQKSRVKGIDKSLEEFSYENINFLEGDILFLNARKVSEADLNKMLKSNIWQTLKVVKNNKIFISDWRYWNYGGVIGAEKVAEDFVTSLKKAGIK